MDRVSARTRIALGLVSLLVSVLLVAIALGLVPDPRRSTMEGRTALCEAIAINSSVLVSRGDSARLEATLQAIVNRNKDILSAALRQDNGKLVVEIGAHSSNWHKAVSDDSNVYVPIWAGKHKWGTVEVRFRPLRAAGVVGFLQAPATKLIAFVAFFCFLLFVLYMRRMLQHLDPSKVVPQRVRSALDTLAEGLLLMDKKERIVLANQAFATNVGHSPERLQGLTVSALPWTKSDANETDSPYPWLQAIDQKSPQTGKILGLHDQNTQKRVFVVNSTPVLSDDGALRGAMASFEDITPLEEKKVELEKSIETAEAASHAKSDFLAKMSHEIRTPMNAILGFTDVLRRGLATDETERLEYLNTIHSSGKHLLDLINDILDLSKVEAGRLEIELSRCSPHELLSEVVSVLRVRAQEKGISLDCRSAGAIPETILTDSVRLRQILVNLVGNAIKFTETGGVQLVPHFLPSRRTPRLAFEVIDSGIGISPEALDKIFDPFVQADAAVTRRFGGTGLGLTISRQFAEALGGELTVASDLGKGSIFTLTVNTGSLEGVKLLVPEVTGLQSTQERRGPELAALPPARILLVEDGESNRRLVKLVLGRAGAKVKTAENGQIAVELVSRNNFDLILMDMEMPVMDGYTATKLLREKGVTVPIVALTAHAMKGQEEKCRAIGCSGYLPKPLDIDQLIQTVSEELGEVDAQGSGYAPRSPEDHSEKAPVVSSLPTDDADFLEIVEEFVERLGEKMALMRKALNEKDLRELASLAHWLKGSGGTAGFKVFTDPAATLECLAKEERVDQIESAIEKLQCLADRIVIRSVDLQSST